MLCLKEVVTESGNQPSWNETSRSLFLRNHFLTHLIVLMHYSDAAVSTSLDSTQDHHRQEGHAEDEGRWRKHLCGPLVWSMSIMGTREFVDKVARSWTLVDGSYLVRQCQLSWTSLSLDESPWTYVNFHELPWLRLSWCRNLTSTPATSQKLLSVQFFHQSIEYDSLRSKMRFRKNN